jgi:hypothetical protein
MVLLSFLFELGFGLEFPLSLLMIGVIYWY